MTDVKDYVSKGLLTGAINSVGSMLIFQGSDIINFRIPFFGNFAIPDAMILALSGFVGQLASDTVHDSMYKTIPVSDKYRQANSALASLASYNAAQLPFLYLGKMPMANVPQYLLLSSACHYASENIYHDILSKRTGGILI